MAYSQTTLANEVNHKKLLFCMTLSEEELCEFFSNFFPKLRVTMQDLKVPKFERMLAIYEAFLNDFGLSLEHLNQCPMVASQNEHLDEAIFSCNFYLVMKRLLNCIGFHELLIRDLTYPKPKRTKLILSLFKNLWEFVHHNYNKYLPMKESMIQESEHLKEYVTKIEALRKNINRIRAKQAEDEPEVKQLEERNMALDQQLQEKCQIKAEMQAQRKSKKVQFANNKAQLAKQTVTSAELREQEEDLDKRTCQSPEKETRSRQQMEQRELDERSRKDEKREKMYEVTKLVERLNNMKLELNVAKVMIQDRQLDIDKLREIQQQVEKLHRFTEDKKNGIQTWQNEIKRSHRLVSIKEESNAKLLIQQPRKMAAIRDSVDQLQREVSLFKQQQSECSEVKSQQIETLTEIEEKLGKNEQHIEELMKEAAAKYAELLMKVTSRHAEVLDKLATNAATLVECQ